MMCHHTAESDAVSLGHLTASSPNPSPDLRPVPFPVEGEHDKTSERKSRDDLGKRARRPNGRSSKSDGSPVSQRQSYLNARQRSPSPLVSMPPFQPSISFTQGGMLRNLTGARLGQDDKKRRKNMGPEQSAVRDLPSTTAKLNGYFHFSLPQRVFHPAIRPIQPHQTTPNVSRYILKKLGRPSVSSPSAGVAHSPPCCFETRPLPPLWAIRDRTQLHS